MWYHNNFMNINITPTCSDPLTTSLSSFLQEMLDSVQYLCINSKKVNMGLHQPLRHDPAFSVETFKEEIVLSSLPQKHTRIFISTCKNVSGCIYYIK